MRNTKKAFTLVELIVVITILAILGTIAFISLQGYSAEARNAKRTSDLSSVASSLSVKLTNGMSVLAAAADTVNTITGINLAGSGTVNNTTELYKAGKVNYTALEMKESEFQDPDGISYVIGATTLAGGVYQLAATVESDGSDTALVTGMYNRRTVASTTTTGSVDGYIFRLSDITKTGNYKFGDTVTINSTDYTIKKVSSDGMSLTLNVNTATGTSIELAEDEELGLIGDGNSTTTATVTTAVEDNSTTALPY